MAQGRSAGLNYYAFHIGDYAVHTRHLSLMEDLAYRRLLDLYYTRERAIPLETQSVCRLIGMRDYETEVSTVLAEFFTETPDGWLHSRCEAEIEAANARAEQARTNGKAGGRPKKTKPEPKENPAETHPVISGNPMETGLKAPNPNPNPNPKEHPPTPKGEGRFPEFWNSWPKSDRKGGRGECLKVWKSKGFDSQADSILAHVAAMAKTESWTKQGGEFIPAPVVYLRGGRWDGADLTASHENFAGAI